MKYILLLLIFLTSQVHAGYAVYQYDSNQYIAQEDATSIRSIASITKLFTAFTVIKGGQALDGTVTVDCLSRGHVTKGTEMTRRDLLIAILVVSDNCAAETLANTYPGGFDKFLQDREFLLRQMGLQNTHLRDATGLGVFNLSTINDLVSFLHIAYQNETLRTIAGIPEAKLTAFKKGRTITITVRNTNPAIFNHSEIVMSKTGFTNAAGRCVLMLVKRLENLYAVVVLGETSLKSRTRHVEKLLAINETVAR